MLLLCPLRGLDDGVGVGGPCGQGLLQQHAFVGSKCYAFVGSNGWLPVVTNRWSLPPDGSARPQSERTARLGFGDTNTPTRVAGLPAPVRQVAASCSHTGVTCSYVEAGTGVMDSAGPLCRRRCQPRPVRRHKRWWSGVSVSTTAVLTETGGVFIFGCVEDWRLGLGFPGHVDPWQRHEPQLTPRRVPAAGFKGQRIVMLAVGSGHTGGAEREEAGVHLG